MAYGEFYVERQGWARWPKVLVMCRKTGRMSDGNVAVERRRYVPERTCNNMSKWPDERLECSECGCITDYVSYEDEPYMMTDEGATIPNFCPNCGARRVDE